MSFPCSLPKRTQPGEAFVFCLGWTRGRETYLSLMSTCLQKITVKLRLFTSRKDNPRFRFLCKSWEERSAELSDVCGSWLTRMDGMGRWTPADVRVCAARATQITSMAILAPDIANDVAQSRNFATVRLQSELHCRQRTYAPELSSSGSYRRQTCRVRRRTQINTSVLFYFPSNFPI